MSAYIVDDTTIDTIVTLVISRTKFPTPFVTIGNKIALFANPEDCKKTISTKLGQLLVDLNYDAVNQRYNENEASHRYTYKEASINTQSAIKALSNLTYQCSEGNVPETALFQQLESELTGQRHKKEHEDKIERAKDHKTTHETNIGKTLREFSVAGPCIPVGKIIKETAKTFTVIDERVRDPKPRRFAKKVKGHRDSFRHTQPCRCCTDHERTTYPNGYMD